MPMQMPPRFALPPAARCRPHARRARDSAAARPADVDAARCRRSAARFRYVAATMPRMRRRASATPMRHEGYLRCRFARRKRFLIKTRLLRPPDTRKDARAARCSLKDDDARAMSRLRVDVAAARCACARASSRKMRGKDMMRAMMRVKMMIRGKRCARSAVADVQDLLSACPRLFHDIAYFSR